MTTRTIANGAELLFRERMMAESEYLDIAGLAKQIEKDAAGHPRILIGVDGPGASGKSTLAAFLADELTNAVVIHVDDFYLPSTNRSGEDGSMFDLSRLKSQVVLPAATGSEFSYQRYNWDTDSLADWISVPAGVPVIVEGVYSLNKSVRDAYTSTVFCWAEAEIRLQRGVDRDGEQARGQWIDDWMPAEDHYVTSERPDEFADIVVDSSVGAQGAEVSYSVLRGPKQ